MSLFEGFSLCSWLRFNPGSGSASDALEASSYFCGPRSQQSCDQCYLPHPQAAADSLYSLRRAVKETSIPFLWSQTLSCSFLVRVVIGCLKVIGFCDILSGVD